MKVFPVKYCKSLENIRKIWYNLRYNVGAGIPVGVYVSFAHNHQEMIIGQIIISAGIVFCLAGKTRYLIVYILPHRESLVKGFLNFFSILKITDAVRPTPHDNYVIMVGQPYGDSFSSKEKPMEFSNTP